MAISNPGAGFSGAAGELNSVPASQRQTLSSNYIDFTAEATKGWAQQFVPDLMEKEAEVFGSRTISGFLEKVGAEEAMSSDQIIWSEQGRLHLSYTAQVTSNNGGIGDGGAGTATSQITLQKEIDGEAVTANGHGVRVNDTIVVANANGVFKCLVVKVAAAVIDVAPYGTAILAATGGANDTTVLVYGSEYAKGARYANADGTAGGTDSRGANEPVSYTHLTLPTNREV